ncbi:MAG: hypothetical protein C4518_01405 [Desulfobacteraceae bacterium]|nr:MAG: hypothetical protein C4518_01405 [Desulfobacteraceae bacterium]
MIEIGSQSSWNPGVFEIFKNIESYFQFAGIEILKHTISRVDLCTDFIDQPFKKFDFGNVEKWICRANHFGVFYSGRIASGISYGKGNLILRVYDKRKELSDKKATAKQEFFNHIWQETSSPVTRVEFQLRREAINELRYGAGKQKIETIYDLLYAQNAIWSYCVKHWARHTAIAVDWENKNHQRTPVSDFWKMVQDVKFLKNNPSDIARIKTKKDYVDAEALVNQGVGCLLAASACSIESTDQIEELLDIASEHLSIRVKNQMKCRYQELEQKIQTVINSNRLSI